LKYYEENDENPKKSKSSVMIASHIPGPIFVQIIEAD